jgi:hypothetical protein
MNRAELVASMNRASSELLRQKGFVSVVDLLIHMGKLSREDHESWRMRRIPYLERVIKLNLGQLSHLQRELRQNAAKGRLNASKTAYVSWGKGAKQPLRFSKSGQPAIEQAYATHFVKRQQSTDSKPSRISAETADLDSEFVRVASDGDVQSGGPVAAVDKQT